MHELLKTICPTADGGFACGNDQGRAWDALWLREVVDAVAQPTAAAKAALVRVQHHPVPAALACTHLQNKM